MTEFEKAVFQEADTTFRVRTYLCKCFELIEMAKLMTDEDMQGLQKIYNYMKEENNGNRDS